MIDISTTYLGLKLRTPLVASASPLWQELSNIRRVEDAGASAVVLPSLFEEQLRLESLELDHHLTSGTESFAEAATFFPQAGEFQLGPEAYLNHIRKTKQAVDIPVIASLNGSTVGGWTQYARQIEQAGADALECNIYYIPTDMDLTGATVEQTYIEILRAVKSAVTIPVAVKLSPFFSNIANMAKRLEQAGADGLVLFNRFYQPDIDLDALEIKPNVLLSTPQALRLPLTWIGILFGRAKLSLAATSGIHTAEDVLKMLMVGTDVTILFSSISQWHPPPDRSSARPGALDGRPRIRVSQADAWQHGQLRCSDPSALERAQYMRAIKSYQAV